MIKKIIILLATLTLAACTTTRYVYIDPKDSVVRKQRVIYDDMYSPFYFDMFTRPYYWNMRPMVVIPIKPQRPSHGPLPPTPKPRR